MKNKSQPLVGLTAQRFAGKPLRQPKYSMKNVPRCHAKLQNSTIQEVKNRDHFNNAMAEMVLLCNEVMRRPRPTISTTTISVSGSETETVNPSPSSSSSSSVSRSLGSERDDSNRSNIISNNVGSAEKQKKKASKPLSLEYIADRCDVDDPIFGFIVRTDQNQDAEQIQNQNETPPVTTMIQKGMMQGFVTVTTFTNWQKTFRWDSLNEAAFSYDEDELSNEMAMKVRKYDESGKLAREIQNTVRCGDPWNEGIVWPRVAEISLLGGMGCGKTLLSLVIERLEAMPASNSRNYDYVVLQATSNSIPFYESQGFIRVGAVTEQEPSKTVTDTANTSPGAETIPKESEPKSEIVTSPLITIATTGKKETLSQFCKKQKVNVWDVIFLNKDIFPGIAPSSLLKKDTMLHIPDVTKLLENLEKDPSSTGGSTGANGAGGDHHDTPQWYDALDNETPREIAKKFGVCHRELVKVNKERITGLQLHSKLVEGTRIQVSNFDHRHDSHVPYCHWTFPDAKFENNEPSYMMARKLTRKSRQNAKFIKPVENSLAVNVTEYIPPPSDIYYTNNQHHQHHHHQQPPPHDSIDSQDSIDGKKNKNMKTPTKKTPKKSKKRKLLLHPNQPIAPKRPKTAFFFYMDEMRLQFKNNNIDGNGNCSEAKYSVAEFTKAGSIKWNNLPMEEKRIYETKSQNAKLQYEEKRKVYLEEMETFKKLHPDWEEYVKNLNKDDAINTTGVNSNTKKKAKTEKMAKPLFNQVVRLNSDGRRETGNEFEYYFVLTYIPDLFWCHLVPMRKAGVFGKRWPKVTGRTKWVLVGEEEGKEIDISAGVCEVVKSKCMKNCEDADADEEEWNIIVEPHEIDSKNSSKKRKLSPVSRSTSMTSCASSSVKENDAPSNVVMDVQNDEKMKEVEVVTPLVESGSLNNDERRGAEIKSLYSRLLVGTSN